MEQHLADTGTLVLPSVESRHVERLVEHAEGHHRARVQGYRGETSEASTGIDHIAFPLLPRRAIVGRVE